MISICICDDNAVSLAQLKILLAKFQEDNDMSFYIKTYSNGEELRSDLAQGIFYKIYLLDVLIPGDNGIEIARQIRHSDENAGILFLTASSKYALEAFTVSATDYMLKPVQYESLSHALFRILTPPKNILEDSKLTVRSGGCIQSIPLQSICYVEVRKNKLIFLLNNGKEIEEYRTLANLQEDLNNHSEFVKIHRSYLINMKYIREITPSEVILVSEHHLPVSRSYSASLKENYFAFSEQFT
ncbi:MAG TPA: LytTR family DNA-binding domain-containing protein [Lachnospiraceae bacterium]|nr:LytTR family DNA-binding domain-containing protein [Lachnospiraceae bacterium]HPF30362.1 LytTR family DNA-binding domain-containing protein [Lachnospiraceae bacterium]